MEREIIKIFRPKRLRRAQKNSRIVINAFLDCSQASETFSAINFAKDSPLFHIPDYLRRRASVRLSRSLARILSGLYISGGGSIAQNVLNCKLIRVGAREKMTKTRDDNAIPANVSNSIPNSSHAITISILKLKSQRDSFITNNK